MASGRSYADRIQAACALGVIAVSIVVADKADAAYENHDQGQIVIDEVAGLVVAAWCVPFTAGNALIVFFVFRFFDIAKPPPIRFLDRNVKRGLGVVIDDVLAGVYTCVVWHAANVLLDTPAVPAAYNVV